MVTLAGTQNNEQDLVKAVLNLEHDALAAYDQTIERLECPKAKAKVSEFRQDHLQHIDALTQIASRFDMEMPDGSMKAVLTTGKIKVADLIGDDATILTAMKTNEYETVMMYENALKKDFLSPELRAICEKGLADERRHRDWMDQAAEEKKRAA